MVEEETVSVRFSSVTGIALSSTNPDLVSVLSVVNVVSSPDETFIRCHVKLVCFSLSSLFSFTRREKTC